MNEERIALLEKYIKEEPESPFNKYALAMEYYEKDPPRSLQILEELISKHSDYLPSYFKAAHLLWDAEKWQEADLIFKTGIELASKLKDEKTLTELKSAYQNFQFEME